MRFSKRLLLAGTAVLVVFMPLGVFAPTLLPIAGPGDAFFTDPIEPLPTEVAALPDTADGGHLTDRDEVGRLVDALVQEQMQRFNLPGAAAVVVHRGAVLHSSGYGYADAVAGRAFDSQTVFRTASVSKLFTATAVMQLVEQGLLDLDADIHDYLDFRVPTRFAEPITMTHLLTHTPGFDERLLGSTASRYRVEDIIGLRDYLLAPDATQQVRPPGMVISYSNYGMALAGYVIERLSGKTFEQYIDDHIHRPLGMARSTFVERVSAPPAENHARAHVYRRGRHEALPQTFENAAPAGSQYSTADDIARFMLANLGDGSLDGERILEPAMLTRLHATAFTHHPMLPGWTPGFVEYHWNGYRLVGHGGDLPGWHSQLTLLPDHDLGVFIHYNGIWPVNLDDDPRMNVVEAVLAAMVPEAGGIYPRPLQLDTATGPAPEGILPVGAVETGRMSVAGNYRVTRYSMTSMEKLLLPNSLLRLHVRERPDGTLRVTMPLGLVSPSEWLPSGDLFYQREGGSGHLAFGADERGRPTHLYGTFMIPLAFERVRWYESEWILLGLFAFSAVAFMGVTLGWPVRSAVRRMRRRPIPERSAGRQRRVILARAVAGTGAVVVVILFVMLFQALTTGDTALLAIQPLLALIAGVCGALAAWLGYATYRGWRADGGPLSERALHGVVAVAGVLFLWQMSYWNVLAF
jgi:CubicO group peptidase (beta-lactamase class C family)